MISSILIVSSTEKSVEFFREVLSQIEYDELVTVKTCGEARRLLLERAFDLCIANCPLTDEFGESFACHASDGKVGQVILVVRDRFVDEVSAKVEDYGVLTVPKPVSREVFWATLRLASATLSKLKRLKSENFKLQQKIEDLRLVNRAKCALIQYLGMSEEDAHRYIEKQAMDLRITRIAVAKNVLKTYEG